MDTVKHIFGGLKKIFKVTGKIFLVVAVLIFVVNLFIIFSPGNKEKINFSKITEQNRAEIYKNVNDKELNSTDQGKAMLSWYRFINCAFIGEACTNNPSDGNTNFNSSIFGYVARGIALPYFNQPASGIYWVHDTLQNSNFIPKSYASEGIGYSALKSLTGLWKIFRNAAYLILVIILITIGFMIMFRVKINPQTVISLENSLPRIVVTLLLITFSFPIAGFMIDLTYIIMALGIFLFSGYIDVSSSMGLLTGDSWSLFNKVFWEGNIWLVGPALFEILPESIGNISRILLGVTTFILITRLFKPVENVTHGEIFKNIAAFFGGIVSTAFGFVATGITITLFITFLAPFILSIIVYLTALVVFFRIFFLLLKSFIMIILLVIFSPIMLLLNAIPGRKMFLTWFKHMLSNLIAFPIVSTLIILASVITTLDNEGKLWKPPFLYATEDKPLLILISVGILFMIPDLVKLIRGAIGIKGGGLTPGGALFFGGAGAAAGTAFAPLQKLGSFAYGFQALSQTKIGKHIFRQPPQKKADEG